MLHCQSMSQPQARAASFCAVRKHHRTEAAEDYTELVSDLISEKGEARVVDIAKRLGITHVTALRTIQRLQADGYLKTAHHKPIKLTPKGARLARFAKARHELLVEFFSSLGVPKHIAEIDAEGAEHHISAATLSCIKRFLQKNQPSRKLTAE